MVEHTGSQLGSVSRRFYADLHSLCVQCCGPRNSAVGDSWLSFSGLCLHSCGTATSCPRLLACEEEAMQHLHWQPWWKSRFCIVSTVNDVSTQFCFVVLCGAEYWAQGPVG